MIKSRICAEPWGGPRDSVVAAIKSAPIELYQGAFPSASAFFFEALQDRIDAIAGLRDSGDSSGFVYGGWAAIIGRKRQA